MIKVTSKLKEVSHIKIVGILIFVISIYIHAMNPSEISHTVAVNIVIPCESSITVLDASASVTVGEVYVDFTKA